MPKRIKHIPNGGAKTESPPKGILELDRFTSKDLQHWESLSSNLDELWSELYFGVEPQRRKFQTQLREAVEGVGSCSYPIEGWFRAVTYQYSSDPLSCAGSLRGHGGRFNAGFELDANTLSPWPALYLAQNFETAYCEKFQLSREHRENGLTPEDLSLSTGGSFSAVVVHGHLDRVFDMTTFTSLTTLATVLRRIKMPTEAVALTKKLKFGRKDLFMITTGLQLFNAVTKQNWRILPAQFGLPAPSHIVAKLIRDAGYAAILFNSSKGPGKCMAIFPDKLTDSSYIELTDKALSSNTITRLDATTAQTLEGWETIPKQYRSQWGGL